MTEQTPMPEDKHRKRMQRQKSVVDTAIEKAQEDRGVVLVHSGNGKGKSSSAFGMVARALGHDMQVGIVQFIKGAIPTGEERFFSRFPEVEFYAMGEGFTWETQDKSKDIQATEKAWAQSVHFLTHAHYGLVVLDELNIALKLNYLPLDAVITQIQNRPPHQHVVITGRGAKPALIEIADTVTEMQDVKHAFRAGVQAQKGIEL